MSRWPDRTMAERFWEKVDRRGPEECWPWMAYINEDGYGIFRVATNESMRQASQVAWELANGKPFPDGLESCHSCDTRSCCNPSHIEPGTHQKNVRDCWDRGRRHNNGECNAFAKSFALPPMACTVRMSTTSSSVSLALGLRGRCVADQSGNLRQDVGPRLR